MSFWCESGVSSSKIVGDPNFGGQRYSDGHKTASIKLKTKRELKSPLEAKIWKSDPMGFFYEQKRLFDKNLVYVAQKL